MNVVAKVEFRKDDKKFEQLYSEYKAAKGALVTYLHNEGFDWTISDKIQKEKPASGN